MKLTPVSIRDRMINIHHSFEDNFIQEQTGMEHFSLSERKLAAATALSSFMVRKIRCQTHFSPGAPHPYLNLLTGHVPIFSVSFGVHLGTSAAQSSYGFKAPHHLLNHNTNCLNSGLNKRFFFFFSSHWSPPLVHMICLRGSPHLIKWASPSLWGLPIKVESKGNSMFPADSDWW